MTARGRWREGKFEKAAAEFGERARCLEPGSPGATGLAGRWMQGRGQEKWEELAEAIVGARLGVIKVRGFAGKAQTVIGG
eukprot:1862608-Lingulodinium_polyedra.AAC.1